MTDVGSTKEQSPPGAWPGSKKGDKAGSPDEPRHSPAVDGGFESLDKHANQAKDNKDDDSESFSHVNYTHRQHDDDSNGPDDVRPTTEAPDPPSEAGDEVTDTVNKGQHKPLKLAEDTKDEAGDAAQDTADKGAEAADETKEQAEDATKDAPSADDAKVPDADEAKEGVQDKAEETTEDAKDKAEETTEDAKDKTEDAAEAAGEKKDELTEVPPESIDDKKDDAVKEGEDATKDLEEKKDDVAKEGEAVPEDATKEAEDAKEGVEGEAGEAAEKAEEEAPLDFSILKGGKVNKVGNVVDDQGKLLGRVTSGTVTQLIGKRVDEKGAIWSDSGKVVGQAEPIPENEREELTREAGPFEAFPDAVVDGNGMVTSNGETIGKVIDGDVKALRGKQVDADGEILDKAGNVVGKAERWEAEPEKEPEPEAEVDRSILAGKRVNKAGNVVDSSGTIYGKVVEGDPKKMIGRMCDKKGNILSESGDVLGRADVVPEGEREGQKEGPFAELSGCTVTKDGKVVTPGGDVVGRLTSGDGKTLFGRSVDEDGDICDRNGNVLGKAERWEEPEVEKKSNPMKGRRVNKEGNVVDTDGNLVGKLTSGELSVCSGKEIDDDGDVVDGKGNTVGHVSLLEDIPKEEETESAEDKEAREKLEQDKKLAKQMAGCLEQCLDKVKPICKMITDKIEKAERTPKEELDEEELVKQVRPLIEEGGKILQESNGIIRGLDPDGRIQANAKHKSATRDATPEEHHLAEVLKELTGTVTVTIDNAKKKIEDMPHAKKQLNPLWGLLNEPLFQILAAVGLLLNGVLSLVGRLLSGLGLGGLLDGLLGTLGLNRLLDGLGLGSFSDSLKGGKDKKKSGGGGLLGLGG